MSNATEILYQKSIELLCELISIPSFSKEEDKTADCFISFLSQHNIPTERIGNNIICRNKYFEAGKPSLLLNSHHDTVKPNSAYTKNPYQAEITDGKLYGLGSNDAGGCLVSLMMAFIHFYDKENLKYNIIYAATAEEEISGKNGIELALQYLPEIDFAIVGEPTLLQMAIAERGLMVLDCIARGKAGHAAREEGENAVGSSRVDLQACKLEYSIVSPK